jgi:hypothetical protein
MPTLKPYNPAEIYDNKWLKTTIKLLEDNLKDLSMWSAWNDDQLNYEIHQLKFYVEFAKRAAQKIYEPEEKHE